MNSPGYNNIGVKGMSTRYNRAIEDQTHVPLSHDWLRRRFKRVDTYVMSLYLSVSRWFKSRDSKLDSVHNTLEVVYNMGYMDAITDLHKLKEQGAIITVPIDNHFHVDLEKDQ